MNENDLRTLLVDRADREAAAASLPPNDRLDAVHGRVRAVRRRRAGLGAVGTAAVVTAAAVTFPSSLGGSPTTPPEPAGVERSPVVDPSPTVSRINGFPEYDNGGRLLESATAPLSTGRVELTFTPSTLHLSSAEVCRAAQTLYVRMHLTSQPKVHWGGTCSAGGSGASVASWRKLGVEIGEPVTLVMRVVGSGVRGQGPVPRGDGELGLAVYETVPFEDYPLPPRPDQLRPLNLHASSPYPRLATIRAEVADPREPVSRQVRLSAGLTVQAQSQTPGILQVFADGVLVFDAEWYDYHQGVPGSTGLIGELRRAGRDVGPGDVVEFRVVPQHVTGDWAVQVIDTSRRR